MDIPYKKGNLIWQNKIPEDCILYVFYAFQKTIIQIFDKIYEDH